MMCTGEIPVSRKGPIKRFAFLNALYIDESPSRQRPTAISCNLPAQQADSPFLNPVVVRLRDPLATVVPEPDQALLCDRFPKHLIHLLIYCHHVNPLKTLSS
jgi:hypothetical protein